jgi:hypothetical protein
MRSAAGFRRSISTARKRARITSESGPRTAKRSSARSGTIGFAERWVPVRRPLTRPCWIDIRPQCSGQGADTHYSQ